MLSQLQATPTRRGRLLRTYKQDLLSRRRETAQRRKETAEGKIILVLTVAMAMRLLLLQVVPRLVAVLGAGPG